MRLPLVPLLSLAAGSASLVLGLAVEACGSNGSSGTTGARVVLHTAAKPAKDPRATFTNGIGWTVTLTKATVAMGAIDYFAGEPLFSRATPPRPRDPLGALLAIREAHAHPGHYVAGDALGEVSAPATIDLFAGTTTLADGAGVTGLFQSARFVYGTLPSGDVLDALGSATQGTRTLAFHAHAAPADVLDADGQPKLEGCPFAAADVTADGTVTLAFDPTLWFDQVDFTDVTPNVDGSPADLAGTIAFRGFQRGLRKGASVTFSYATP